MDFFKRLFAMLVQKDDASKRSGIMVALYVPAELAAQMALPDGEKPEDLHITLAYYPGIGDDDEAFERMVEALQLPASVFGPVDGVVGGLGRFNATDSSDGRDVFYASFDSPQLASFRECVVGFLRGEGFEDSRAHGYVPHITLKYIGQDEALPDQRIDSAAFGVPSLSIASGTRRVDLPLSGKVVTKSEEEAAAILALALTLVEKGGPGSGRHSQGGRQERPGSLSHGESHSREMANGDQHTITAEADKFKLTATSQGSGVESVTTHESLKAAFDHSDSLGGGGPAGDVAKMAPIFKADNSKQIVYGVILTPNEVDAQEDWMTAEDIEKSAHEYLIKSRTVGKNHSEAIRAVPVESFIAPCDFQGSGQYGNQLVKKGSWVMGVRVVDPAEWAKVVAGEYQGFSVGGFGLRKESSPANLN